MHTVVDALNTLELVTKGNEDRVTSHGLYYRSVVTSTEDERFCIVGAALHRAGVSVAELTIMGPLKIDHLYERGLAPLDLSLGGMIVYRAAQRTQDGLTEDDRSWGAAFDNAVVAASRVIDLVSDSAVAAACAEVAFA
jgi:hypothetical protein